MTSRKPSEYVRVECTVLDEDTVRIGGSVFKRISGEDAITQGATICRRCGMKINEVKGVKKMTMLELLRRTQNLKQIELSEMSGVAQNYISSAENGRYVLCKMHLEKLSRALGWDGEPEALLNDAEVKL